MFQGYTITRYMCWLCLRIHKIYTYSLFNTYCVNFILYIFWACASTASIMHPLLYKVHFSTWSHSSINKSLKLDYCHEISREKNMISTVTVYWIYEIYIPDAKSWLMLKHWIISLGRDYAGHLKSCRVDFHLNRIWNSWWGNVNTQILTALIYKHVPPSYLTMSGQLTKTGSFCISGGQIVITGNIMQIFKI